MIPIITNPQDDSLEDHFQDIMEKAQKGLRLGDLQLSRLLGCEREELKRWKSKPDQSLNPVHIAEILGLNPDSFINILKGKYLPKIGIPKGLTRLAFPFYEGLVNAYLLDGLDPQGPILIDCGLDALAVANFLKESNAQPVAILITHDHPDHTARGEWDKVFPQIPAYGPENLKTEKSTPLKDQQTLYFPSGNIVVRETSGHAAQGFSFWVSQLNPPLLFTGDALFAGSMGGPIHSYEMAMKTNARAFLDLPPETIVCPGHGPLTTLDLESRNNPFWPFNLPPEINR